MMTAATAFLVVRRDDGFGDVFPLTPNERFTMGRAPTNRIVLKDDLCSREHAEFSFSAGRWWVRDLNSLNGVRLNGDRIQRETELDPNDVIEVGHTQLLFIEDMEQLPDLPSEPAPEGVSIKKRLGQTRFLTPLPPGDPEVTAPGTAAA